jgi:hypothetical protein
VAAEATPTRGRQRHGGFRKAWLVLALVPVFITFGVPRWLAGDDQPASTTPTAASFTKLCREHGGTPATAPATGTAAAPQPFCTVKYGGRVYRMDAITPHGFDTDTARFQRAGCEQERHTAGRGETFVYHPTTGVCERRS